MCGVIGREIDREAGLDGRGDEAPVLDTDRTAAEDGLVGEGDCVLAGIGDDELLQEATVDLRTVSRQIACLGVAPEATGQKRRDLCAELCPGRACQATGYAIPMHGEGAGFGVAAVFVECAARPA